MIFSRVSPWKGKRFILTMMVIPLLGMTVLGVSSYVDTSPVAASAESSVPILIQGVGQAVGLPETSGVESGLRKREVVLDARLLAGDDAVLPDDTVMFDLFEDVAYSGTVESISEPVPGVQNFSGRILDKAYGYFSVSLDDAGRSLAQIEIQEEGKVYVVAEDVSAGGYQVTEFLLEDQNAVSGSSALPTPVPEAL